MNPDKFKELLDELDGNSLQTLKEKNARYAQNGDCLHNFRSGADVAGGTPAQACWGYMTKHLVALRDMVERDDFSNREDFLEKCQDTINYIRFLWCIGNDENTEMRLYDICGKEVTTVYTDRLKPCRYAKVRHSSTVCYGTAELDLCPGYNKCDRYKPID